MYGKFIAPKGRDSTRLIENSLFQVLETNVNVQSHTFTHLELLSVSFYYYTCK